MPAFERVFEQDLNQMVEVRPGGGLLFTGDAFSLKVTVRLTRGGVSESVEGTCIAKVIRSDGATVVVEGAEPSGNEISATLPASCFTVAGPLAVILQIVSGDVKTTVLKAVYNVTLGTTDTIVDPGHVVPDISDIIAMMDDAEEATAAANAAAENAGGAIEYFADAYDPAATYTVGKYVINNGGLYRCTTAIETAEAWNAEHWTQVTVGGEVESVNTLASQAKAKADEFDVTQKRGFTYEAYGDDFTGRRIAGNNDVTVTKTGPMVVFNGVQQTTGVGFAISGDTFAWMAHQTSSKAKKVGYTTNKLTLKAGRTYLAKVHFVSGSFTTTPGATGTAYFRLALDTLDSSIAEPVDDDVVDNYIMDVTGANGDVLQAADMADAAQIIQPATDIRCGFVIYWKGNIDVDNFTLIVEIEETAAPYNVVRPHRGVYSTNHRGWYQCPENTLTAYRQSAAHGFKQVETDVRFTSDDVPVPVLLHDASINRTARNADGTEISGTINIASITYEQARTYDFGVYKGAQFAGEKIPTLEEFLELCRDIGVVPYIELQGSPTNATVESVVNVVNKSAIRNDIVFISNDVNWLSCLIRYFPSNRFGVTPFNYSDTYRAAAVAMFNNRAEIFMNMARTQVTSEIIATLKASNIPLEIWVAEEDDIRNADGYITGFSSNQTLANNVLYRDEIPSYLPIRWRMGHLAETGAFSPHMKGVTSDYLIPTAICDRVIRLGSKYIYIGYYRVSNGKTVFDNRVTVPSNATQYVIDKTYPYFAVTVFDNWNVMALEDGDNNVALQYLPASNDAIRNAYLYSLTNNQNKKPSDTIWSICHQGYHNGQLGHNLPGGYAEAASRGFTHAECDTRLTSDNEVVCCHDTSFVDDNSGDTIVIANHTLAELKTYSYYGGTIATLGEIITECRSVGLGLFIDQITTATESYVYDVVKRYNAINMCYFMSTDINALSSIINRDPAANIGFVGYIVSTNHSTVIPQLQALNHDVIYDLGSYDGNRTPAEVAAIAALLPGNMRLILWTIDNTKWINDVLPYICGWTSNGVSGRDIFNPETVVGLDCLKQM